MPRSKVGKKRTKVNPEDMKKALQAVKEGMSIRSAADKFSKEGIKITTLHRMWKKSQLVEDYKYSPPKYDCHRVFTKKEEEELVMYIIEVSRMQYGLRYKEVRRLAFLFAEANHKKYPKSWKSGEIAGKEWLRGFMKRYKSKLALRKPEATSLGRASAFNRHTVNEFFKNLAEVHEKYGPFTPENIYNVDEHGLTTVQTPAKVVAQRGERQVGSVTSAERGVLVTLIGAANAMGNHIPPVLIFPRVHPKENMVIGAPPGTIPEANPSGWVNERIFLNWMKHFVKFTGALPNKRILLIFDNHESHLSPNVVKYAKENGVVLLTIPPHTSHRLQPLDVAVYGPLKIFYGEELDTWHRNNPGKTFTIYNIAAAFGNVYARAFSTLNIMSGFEQTGIYPFNDQIFKDKDYLSSYVTDRPLPASNSLPEDVIIDSAIPTSSSTLNADHGPLLPQDVMPYPKALPRAPSTRGKLQCITFHIIPLKHVNSHFLSCFIGRRRGRTTILTKTPEKPNCEPDEPEEVIVPKMKMRKKLFRGETKDSDEDDSSSSTSQFSTQESGDSNEDFSDLAEELQPVVEFPGKDSHFFVMCFKSLWPDIFFF